MPWYPHIHTHHAPASSYTHMPPASRASVSLTLAFASRYYEPYFGPYQPLAFATSEWGAKSLAYSCNIGDMWAKKAPEGVPLEKSSPAIIEEQM